MTAWLLNSLFGYINFAKSKTCLRLGFYVLLSYISDPFFPELNKNPVEGFSAGLIDDDDIYKWEVVIIGPQDTLL